MPEGSIYHLANQIALPAGSPAAVVNLPATSTVAGLDNLGIYDWGVFFIDLELTGEATVTFTLQGKLSADGDWFDLTLHQLSGGVDETVQASSIAISASCTRALCGMTIPVLFVQLNAQLSGTGTGVLSAWLRLSE